MAPVHHARNDDVIDVAENPLERFAFFGSTLRELLANRPRLVVRRDAQLVDALPKIRNPVREFMQLFPEFVRRRVTERLLPMLHGVSFINTLLKRGGKRRAQSCNRFSGFQRT